MYLVAAENILISGVAGKAISAFGNTDPHVRRHEGDRNALWYAIFVTLVI